MQFVSYLPASSEESFLHGISEVPFDETAVAHFAAFAGAERVATVTAGGDLITRGAISAGNGSFTADTDMTTASHVKVLGTLEVLGE